VVLVPLRDRAWGNQFLWGYNEDQDPELQQVGRQAGRQGRREQRGGMS
jgi:hypothetical protein